MLELLLVRLLLGQEVQDLYQQVIYYVMVPQSVEPLMHLSMLLLELHMVLVMVHLHLIFQI